ncbi:MAG: YfjI family protein [Actinomycetota bacterium]|nr:YfjI family protein [Actinomycetota bacterium]
MSDYLAPGNASHLFADATPRTGEATTTTDVAPIPLTNAPDLPPFPTDAFPGWLQEMVEGVAEFTQTDAGMAGTISLGVLAAVAGGHAEVQVRPGWREPVNVFTVVAAPPGQRKSPVFATFTAPLRDGEKELVDKSKAQISEAQVMKLVAEMAAQVAQREASTAPDNKRDEKTSNAISARDMADSIEVPVVPRLLADDVTPEALGSLLADQGGHLAVISAEGGVFDVLAGRYSALPNLDIFLKGHAGDEVRVDRKGRPPEYIARPALTVCLAVQPAVLDTIGRNTTFAGRGLLARFLYSLPPSKVGHRVIGAPPVPEPVATAYADRVKTLAITMHTWTDPAVLLLDPGATEILQTAEAEIEPKLGPGGELAGIVDWASKWLGAVARIAGLLHLAEHGEAGVRRLIGQDTVHAALAIGDYFTAHALGVFELMRIDRSLDVARDLLAHVHARRIEKASVRELHVALSRSRFPKSEDVVTALTILEDYGWAERLTQPPTTGPGRPPSPRYRFTPPQKPQNTQKPAVR